MKKIIMLVLTLLFASTLYGRRHEAMNSHRMNAAIDFMILEELKDAGYTILPEVIVTAYRNDQDTIKAKKSKIEYDDLYYIPSKDGRQMKHLEKKNFIPKDAFDADTLITNEYNQKKEIVINNYYDNDPFSYSYRLRHFYHPTFYFSWNWYRPYWGWNSYWYWNDPFYYDWYYPYYGWYSPFYFNFGWHGSYSYYGHYNYVTYNKPYNNIQYGRRERPSTLILNQASRRVVPQQQQPQRREIVPPQNRPQYSESRRTYTPSYEKPRMSVRPEYNNSRIQRDNTNMHDSRSNATMQNERYRSNTQTRTEVSTQIRTETRTYQPSMERRSSSYSTPSRSYSPPTINRSSDFNNRSSNFNSTPSRSSGSNMSGSGFSGSGSSSRSSGSSSSTSTSSGSHSGTRR